MGGELTFGLQDIGAWYLASPQRIVWSAAIVWVLLIARAALRM